MGKAGVICSAWVCLGVCFCMVLGCLVDLASDVEK